MRHQRYASTREVLLAHGSHRTNGVIYLVNLIFLGSQHGDRQRLVSVFVLGIFVPLYFKERYALMEKSTWSLRLGSPSSDD